MSSEFGGLWEHENNQHARVPQKTECGCPSGGGIENGSHKNPSYGGTQKKEKKKEEEEEYAGRSLSHVGDVSRCHGMGLRGMRHFTLPDRNSEHLSLN